MNEDLKTGIAIALCSRGRRFVKREPVAHLYGPDKVRLPDIYSVYTPELQNDFPFLVMTYYDQSESQRIGTLYALSKIEYITTDTGGWCISLANQFVRTTTQKSNGEIVGWNEFGNPTTSVQLVLKDSIFKLIWANFDIYDEDGKTIYLAGSDPVPVYE